MGEVEGDLPVEILPEGILSPEISPTGTLPYGIFPELLIGNLPAEISPKSKKEISPKELSLQEKTPQKLIGILPEIFFPEILIGNLPVVKN